MATTPLASRSACATVQANRLYARLTGLIGNWRRNLNSRKTLAGLPDFMLKDLGISRSEVEQEYRKPFWKD